MTKFIDTNIIVYTFDIRDAKKHKIAIELLEHTWNNTIPTAISVQVLGELCRVLTEKIPRPFGTEQVQVIIEKFLELKWDILEYSPTTILKALELKKYKLSFWDALIAATMLENNVHEIYTEDENFSRVPGIKVINPFHNA